MSSDPYSEMVAQLATTPDLVAQLLQTHTPTESGLCRTHHERHPCTIRLLAERAAAITEPSRSRTASRLPTGAAGRSNTRLPSGWAATAR